MNFVGLAIMALGIVLLTTSFEERSVWTILGGFVAVGVGLFLALLKRRA